MATATDTSCENTSQTNGDFETTESDTELQNIFRKLRVNHRSKKLQSRTRRTKTTKLQTKTSGHLLEKHKRRKIIKDATFIFTSTMNKTENKTDGNLSVKELKDSLLQSEPQGTTSPFPPPGGQHRVQGCGEQFRNGANVRVSDSLNMDDTTPEELAAYFDQLLHIPKPMSQMAEMMYT